MRKQANIQNIHWNVLKMKKKWFSRSVFGMIKVDMRISLNIYFCEKLKNTIQRSSAVFSYVDYYYQLNRV